MHLERQKKMGDKHLEFGEGTESEYDTSSDLHVQEHEQTKSPVRILSRANVSKITSQFKIKNRPARLEGSREHTIQAIEELKLVRTEKSVLASFFNHHLAIYDGVKEGSYAATSDAIADQIAHTGMTEFGIFVQGAATGLLGSFMKDKLSSSSY